MTVGFRNDRLLDIPMKKVSQICVGVAALALAVAVGTSWATEVLLLHLEPTTAHLQL